jgi:hypothetical protein
VAGIFSKKALIVGMNVNRYQLFVIGYSWKPMSKGSFKTFEDLECWKACTDLREKSYSLLVISEII